MERLFGLLFSFFMFFFLLAPVFRMLKAEESEFGTLALGCSAFILALFFTLCAAIIEDIEKLRKELIKEN